MKRIAAVFYEQPIGKTRVALAGVPEMLVDVSLSEFHSLLAYSTPDEVVVTAHKDLVHAAALDLPVDLTWTTALGKAALCYASGSVDKPMIQVAPLLARLVGHSLKLTGEDSPDVVAPAILAIYEHLVSLTVRDGDAEREALEREFALLMIQRPVTSLSFDATEVVRITEDAELRATTSKVRLETLIGRKVASTPTASVVARAVETGSGMVPPLLDGAQDWTDDSLASLLRPAPAGLLDADPARAVLQAWLDWRTAHACAKWGRRWLGHPEHGVVTVPFTLVTPWPFNGCGVYTQGANFDAAFAFLRTALIGAVFTPIRWTWDSPIMRLPKREREFGYWAEIKRSIVQRAHEPYCVLPLDAGVVVTEQP